MAEADSAYLDAQQAVLGHFANGDEIFDGQPSE
jgi:hypothetical protein